MLLCAVLCRVLVVPTRGCYAMLCCVLTCVLLLCSTHTHTPHRLVSTSSTSWWRVTCTRDWDCGCRACLTPHCRSRCAAACVLTMRLSSVCVCVCVTWHCGSIVCCVWRCWCVCILPLKSHCLCPSFVLLPATHQVERLLPLCECVFVIKRFVETRSQIQYPMVAQVGAKGWLQRTEGSWPPPAVCMWV